MFNFLKKNWFMLGLVAISLTVIADGSGILVTPGLWLKQHGGPDAVIVLIFFLSGIALDIRQIREGLSDIRGTLLALILIFLIAPVIGTLFSFLPMETGVIIGILLVASMPTTLSSGVVMTGSAGGNMAHALLITVIANALAVATIPLSLSLLLGFSGNSRIIEIDQLPIMIKIATLVLLPLVAGITCRRMFNSSLQRLLPYTSTSNQLGILTMVWMALCSSRPAIVSGLDSIVLVTAVVFFFHLFLVLTAIYATKLLAIPKKRRESVIFMGGQKTLPLSVILQVSLFPEYGIALVVCVVHHIVHLIMDAYLIKYLLKKG
jgi:sodium/bile acid cotransporter 7